VALGSTQSVTEMSTTNISWRVEAAGLTTLPPSRASTSWNPKGLCRPVMRLLYLLVFHPTDTMKLSVWRFWEENSAISNSVRMPFNKMYSLCDSSINRTQKPHTRKYKFHLLTTGYSLNRVVSHLPTGKILRTPPHLPGFSISTKCNLHTAYTYIW
jgi:hypothetical protein